MFFSFFCFIETDDEEEEEEEEDTYDQEDEDCGRVNASSSQETKEVPGPSESKRMRHSRGVKELLTMKLSVILDRCKVSDRNASRIIIATVEALGQNPDDFVVSKTALHVRRRDYREKYTEEIQKRIKIDETEAVVVHWDGKLLPGVVKTEQNERIAISISYGQNEQLLGVPVIDSSSGEEEAIAVFETLEQWGVSHTVKAMCFDTTASNTGKFKGACTILEQMLGKELLYLACRHHILEVLLRGVFECKLGSTTGPQPDIFKRFQNTWLTINKEKYEIGITDKLINKHLTPEVIKNISDDLKVKLTECQPRDDYKELMLLVLVFVGELDGHVVGFRTPGAIHHARWMAKAIYSLKIFLFRSQFKMSNEEQNALGDICVFLVKLYCKAWFNAPKAYLAPKQDLELLRSLFEYQKIDKDISVKALAKCSNHLWYLNSELVGLAYFDPTLSNIEKSEMAKKLLSSTTETENSRIVNPKLQKYQLKQLVEAGLHNIITKETMEFFNRLNINTDFLRESPNVWHENTHFKEGFRIVQSLKVVNDMAERGVKLISDFNDLLTKDEDQKQYVLQVVSECRKQYPDVSKATLHKSLY